MTYVHNLQGMYYVQSTEEDYRIKGMKNGQVSCNK